MTCKSPSGPLERSLENLVNRKQREAESRRKKRVICLRHNKAAYPPPPTPQNGFTKRQATTPVDSVILRWCKSNSIKHGNITADQTAHPAAPGLMEQRGWEMFQYSSMAAIWCGAATSSSVYFYLWTRSGHFLAKERPCCPPLSRKTVFALLHGSFISPEEHLSWFSTTTLNVSRCSLQQGSIISISAVDSGWWINDN